MTSSEKASWLHFGDLRISGDYIKHTSWSFKKNKRADAIRNECIVITRNMARMLWDDSLSKEDRQNMQNESYQAGQHLAEFGITEGIHTARRQKTFWKSSLITAEYVAGQLLPYSGYKPRSEKSLKPIFEEFTIVEDDQVIETKMMPQRITDFFVDGWIVFNAADSLDCFEEVNFKTTGTGLFIGS